MSSDRAIQQMLPAGLAAAILADILVSWTSRYWPVTVGIAGISLVVVAWALSVRRVTLPRETFLVIAIGIWGPVQMLFHVSVLPSVTLQGSLPWIMAAIVFILASQILRDPSGRRSFLRLILWAVTALAVVAMLQAFTSPIRVFGIFPAEPTVVGTMTYRNYFAAMMELAAPIALWEVRNGKLVAGGLCYSAMFAATVTSASRAGVIGILAELLVFIVLMILGRRLKVGQALAVAGVLAVLVTGAGMIAGTERIGSRFQESNPYNLRKQLTLSTVDMIRERPVLGFGIGTWRSVYPRFARYDDALIANEAHNDLLEWAAEGGIPFLLLMTVLVAWLWKRVFQSVWAIGLIAVFVHSYVDYPLRASSLQFLWFAIAGAVTQFDAHSQRRG